MARRWVTVSIVTGGVVGIVLRNLPLNLAIVLARGSSTRTCGMQETLDCAFANLPDAIVALIRFAAVLLAVSTVLLAVAITMIAIGGHRIRSSAQAGSSIGDLALLTAGVAAFTPVIWLALSLAWTIVR
jgi:hypothetical protein